MPKEGELLYKDKPLVEITTKTQQQDLIQGQTTTDLQDQMTATMLGTTNADAVTQVLGADQFAPAPEQRLSRVSLDFSARGGVVSEDDSTRMKSIRRAVASYFQKKNEYDASAEGSMERAIAAEALIKDAEAIISSCKWYCLFRHPFTSRGIARKKEVKELRLQVESTVHALKLETININYETKKKRSVESTREIQFLELKNGKKELVFGGKEMTYEASDRARLHHKEYLKDLALEDKRCRKSSWNKKVRELLDDIVGYADIHTTAMHVSTASRMASAKSEEIPDRLKKKYRKKVDARRTKLALERGYLKSIMDTIKTLDEGKLSQEEKEIVGRYKTLFNEMVSGTLKEEADAAVIDVTNKKDNIIYTDEEGKKATDKFRVSDRKMLTLFAQQPCTQDIAQGGLGDCYFLTTLTTIVKNDPDYIRSMMKDNGDSVTVRFFRYDKEKKKRVPVYVKTPKVWVSYGSKDTLWVQMMELAYTAYLQKEREVGSDSDPAQKDKPLELGHVGNGGNPIYVYADIYGSNDFEFVGVDSPTFLDRPDILERTRDAVAYICSNSGETAVLLEEEKELLKYGNFDVLYSKTFTLDGNLKKGADPKNAELCNKLFERRKELFAKTMKQNINVFYDEMEESFFTSFKEVNEKLREINDRWLKTVPEAMALMERRDRIRQELLPKAKEGSEEYKQLVEERDRIARELGDKGIIPYILYASNEKVPGESMGVYENDKKKQIRALQDDSDNLQELIRKKLGIGKGGDIEQKKENLGKMIEALKQQDFEEFKDKASLFSHMIYTPYRTGDEEQDKREAFELVRLHAIKSCEGVHNSITELSNSETSSIFTGVYSRNAKNLYSEIKACLDAGKRATAGTRDIKGKTDGLGPAGEKKIDGISGNHAYAIMDAGEYDYKGKKILMLKLRNPWAGYACKYTVDDKGQVVATDNNKKTNGEFWMEMTDFAKRFSHIVVEKLDK